MKTNEQITELMHAYFSGQISPEDSRCLENVLKESPEMVKEFRLLSELYGHMQADFIEKNLDVNNAWQHLMQKLPGENTVLKGPIIENHFSRSYRWMAVAAILTIIFISSFILFFTFAKSDNIIVYIATDSVQSVQLSDGSNILLNKGSILISPKKFSGNVRNVILFGNAYFEVSHNKDFPFIVSSENVSVKVLGTKFFVNTNSESKKMEVALTEGRVEVFNNVSDKIKVELQPGEIVEFPQQGNPDEKTKIDDNNFMAWQTGILEFRDTRLLDVVNELNQTYHANIMLKSNTIADCRISATFQHQPVDAILKVIASTLNLQIENVNSQIILSGNPCNDTQH